MINYEVKPCKRADIKDFIEYWHYSHSINGVISDYCFGLYDGRILIGAAIFGRLAMANQWRKYTDSPSKLIELRRLACVDEAPRNTESYFIARCLRWLKKNTEIETVLTYADETYGHKGTIYKASNFKYRGMTAPGKVILYNNQVYHDKAIRTKHKGQIKPFAKLLKAALDAGDAEYIKTQGKHIYTYNLR